jgi:hypothetical protein
MTAECNFSDWHQSRIEGLLLDVAERLSRTTETIIVFQFPRPEAFQRAVLQQLDWSGYVGRFDKDSDSGLPKLTVQRQQ